MEIGRSLSKPLRKLTEGTHLVKAIEQALQALFPGYSPLLTSRGSTALYLALQAIRQEKGTGDVILPETICPSVPLVIHLAGFRPRFCDVEKRTLCMSRQTVASLITPKTRAILVVYLFGKTIDITGIMDLASHARVPVIEDVAQGIGGTIQGRPLGSFGDFSIISFDETKILRGRGGALLIREPHYLPDIYSSYLGMPLAPERKLGQEWECSFRDLTMSYFNFMWATHFEGRLNMPISLLEGYRLLFIHRRTLSAVEIEPTLDDFFSLQEEKNSRFAKVLSYRRNLKGSVLPVHFSREEMCWRLPLLLQTHEQQLSIIENLRAKGYLVSNHYPPVSSLFGERPYSVTKEIGEKVINLWVDKKVNEEDIPRICCIIRECSQC